MRTLVLCACILTCIFFTSPLTLKIELHKAISGSFDDLKACMDEVGLTNETIFKESDIINGVYLEPEMEERKRKFGCLVTCTLRKADIMNGSEIIEQKIQSEISRMMKDFPMRIEMEAHEIMHDCILKVNDKTTDCEKGFKMMECTLEGAYRLSRYEGYIEHQRLMIILMLSILIFGYIYYTSNNY